MKARRLLILLLLALAAGVVAGPGVGQQSNGNPSDKEAIAKNAEAFVEAFHKGDAAAVAAFWTSDGDYTDLQGKHLKGREAIQKGFQQFFAENKGLSVRIESQSLRFVNPEVAIEDGTSYVIHPAGLPASRARYTIIHVKKDEKWLISSVRDAPYIPPSNYENLRGVEWAVGTWSSESDKGDSEHLDVSWTDNQNFLIANFSTSVGGVAVGSVTHWIGWDPRTKRVRSWMFDAEGGFGEGAWTKEGDQWVVKATSIQRDGKSASAVFHLGRIDADTICLQATDRVVAGKAVPDTKQFKLKRVK